MKREVARSAGGIFPCSFGTSQHKAHPSGAFSRGTILKIGLHEKAYRRGEQCSPGTPPSSLRLATSSKEEALPLSPLLEEMPGRAEESFVSLEKGDVTVGDRGIFKFLQRVTLLFFFAKKKKRSKKRKALAYPYSNRQHITRLAVFSQLYQQNGFSVGYRTPFG